eukprot:1596309-Pyramimonas_sp.AAC.3
MRSIRSGGRHHSCATGASALALGSVGAGAAAFTACASTTSRSSFHLSTVDCGLDEKGTSAQDSANGRSEWARDAAHCF